MKNLPVYHTSASIAAELGVGRSAFSNWLTRHDDHPMPAALARRIGDEYAPLWTEDQLPSWKAWYTARHAPRTRLTTAQQHALYRLRRKGRVLSGQGIDIRTARKLAGLGMARMVESIDRGRRVGWALLPAAGDTEEKL